MQAFQNSVFTSKCEFYHHQKILLVFSEMAGSLHFQGNRCQRLFPTRASLPVVPSSEHVVLSLRFLGFARQSYGQPAVAPQRFQRCFMHTSHFPPLRIKKVCVQVWRVNKVFVAGGACFVFSCVCVAMTDIITASAGQGCIAALRVAGSYPLLFLCHQCRCAHTENRK